VREVIAQFVRPLCAEPESVSISEAEAGGVVVYCVRTAPGDVGRIIGRSGRNIQALRTLAEAVAVRMGIDKRNLRVEVFQPQREVVP
jgi:hypothetical protein